MPYGTTVHGQAETDAVVNEILRNSTIETEKSYPNQGIELHETLLIIMSVVVLGSGLLKLQAFSPALGSDALIVHRPMGKA